MTQWIRNNLRTRIIKPISMPAVLTLSKERVLNVVPGLDPQRTRMKCVPKAAAPRLEQYLQSGDLIFFCIDAQESRYVSFRNHRA